MQRVIRDETLPIVDSDEVVHLSDIYLRDVCILPDDAKPTYSMVGPGRDSLRIYTVGLAISDSVETL